MNDEEEVVYSSEQEQEQPQETSVRKRQPLNERVGEGIDKVGKTMENVGKAEEKLADLMDGGEKAKKGVDTLAGTATDVADKGTAAAEKIAAAREKAADVTAKGAGVAKNTAGTVQAGAKVGKGASKGVQGVGQGVSAAGSSPYTAALKPVGEGIKAGGKVGEGISTGVEAGATAAKESARVAEEAAKVAKREAQAEKNATRAANKAAKAAKKSSDLAKKANNKSTADKLRQRGKLHQAQGKRLQELSKKFDSRSLADDAFDKLGKGKNALKGIFKIFDPKVFGVLLLLILIFGTVIVFYVLSPMFWINQAINSDSVEKARNFISGLGLKDSEEAFYADVNYWQTHYGGQVDFPYIMSPLYYTDIFYGDSEYDSIYEESNLCKFLDKTELDYANACDKIVLGVRAAKIQIKELRKALTTTTGDNGLTYSANKIYRMRELVKHQFLGGKELKTASLDEYIELCKERLGNELSVVMEYAPYLAVFLVAYAIIHTDPTFGAVTDTMLATGIATLVGDEIFGTMMDLVDGTENWTSIKVKAENGGYSGVLGEIVDDIVNFFKVLYNCVFEIESIDLKFDTDAILTWLLKSIKVDENYNIDIHWDNLNIKDIASVNINYYDYKFDEKKYEEYLVDEYIRYMPEYSKLLTNSKGEKLTGDDLENRIQSIAGDIKLLRDIFNSIYNQDESAQKYSGCIGDINLDLLNELTPPVKLTIGQRITFSGSNNYGLYNGIVHYGVDLEEESTNTKEGDEVYSIYNGVVSASTVDGSYKENVNGGWVVIDYDIQYSNINAGLGVISKIFKYKKSSIKVYYGGLNPDTLKLKKGDIVEKGEVIGHVGNASMSETGEKPSVHFSIYDLKKGIFLNPINMFITCRKLNAGSCTNGGTTLELPSSVFDLYQTNYTITFYDERGFGSLGIDPHSPQKKVHQLWLDDGLRFKNGIAIVNVDGVDRYLAAVTKNFGAVGDLAYANLEDGTALPLIIADEKDYDNTNNDGKVDDPELCMSPKATDPACYGHLSGKSLSVIEFEFDNQYLYKGFTSATQLEQEWNTNQKVISISNCGSAIE